MKYNRISTIFLLILSMILTVSCGKRNPISISKRRNKQLKIFTRYQEVKTILEKVAKQYFQTFK